MESRICGIQYIGKSETEFNVRLNDCEDVNRKNASLVDRHFKLFNHNFFQHTTFTLIMELQYEDE